MERVFNHFDGRAEFSLKDGHTTNQLLATESKSDGYCEMGTLTFMGHTGHQFVKLNWRNMLGQRGKLNGKMDI